MQVAMAFSSFNLLIFALPDHFYVPALLQLMVATLCCLVCWRITLL
jgi:hypothetical protein